MPGHSGCDVAVSNMPIYDLRKSSLALDALAPFKVLSVMCYPGTSARFRRERMIARIQSGTGEGQPRRRPLSKEEFFKEVHLNAGRAGVAGSLLMTQLQLHLNGYRASFNRARPLVLALLPLWEQAVSSQWSADAHVGHRPRTRPRMLAAYNGYRPAVHFWAAMIHGLQHGRDDIWPGSNETLPTFLAFAQCFLDLASELPSPDRKRRFAMNRSEAWHFLVPDHMRQEVKLVALPLTAEQQRILDELNSPKR